MLSQEVLKGWLVEKSDRMQKRKERKTERKENKRKKKNTFRWLVELVRAERFKLRGSLRARVVGLEAAPKIVLEFHGAALAILGEAGGSTTTQKTLKTTVKKKTKGKEGA